MRYTTINLETSLTLALAEFLKAQGYDIYWHSAGALENHTAALATSKAVITLVPDFPADPATILSANPANVQRLKAGELGEDELVVPALSLQMLGPPAKGAILGLGHKDYDWVRSFRVDGFAADQYQHRELADALMEWLSSGAYQYLSAYDYSVDPLNPTPLQAVEVIQERSTVQRGELIHDVEAVRYYIQSTARIAYVE